MFYRHFYILHFVFYILYFKKNNFFYDILNNQKGQHIWDL